MYFVWWPQTNISKMDYDDSGLLFFLTITAFLCLCLWINYYRIKSQREKRERCMEIEAPRVGNNNTEVFTISTTYPTINIESNQIQMTRDTFVSTAPQYSSIDRFYNDDPPSYEEALKMEAVKKSLAPSYERQSSPDTQPQPLTRIPT